MMLPGRKSTSYPRRSKMIRAHRRTTAHEEIPRKTSKHPKINKTREDKTAYDDQRQRPDITNGHQGGL
jgi:hypothetical protein